MILHKGPLRTLQSVPGVKVTTLGFNSRAAVFRKVTSSLVTRVRKGIQAGGRHFEQFACVLNGESVTVPLTTYLNKCTMLLFLFQFIYCNLKTHNFRTVANWTHVYMTFWTQSQLWN